MRALRRASAAAALTALLTAAVTASEPSAARAATGEGSGAVVVIVEEGGAGLTPADVRSIVADKLGVAVLAPNDPAAKEARGVLTITFMRAEKQIIVSFRSREGTETSQVAILPGDPAAASASIASLVDALTGAKKLAEEPAAPAAEPPKKKPAKPRAMAPSNPFVTPDEPPPPPLSSLPYFPVNLSLLYPLSTNPGRPNLRTNIDIAIMASRVGAVEGFQGGVLTYSEYEVRGLQTSVAAISGKTTGLQLGVAFAFADGEFNGAQVGGIFGWSGEDISGVQIGGVASQSFKDVRGLQLSGGASITRGEVHGVQAAGLVNIGRVHGLQIGIINVSAEVKGLQLGIFNVARRMDGFQLGLVNITDSLNGESLGLANLLRPGAIHLSVWGSNSLNGNIGLKFASKYAYSLLSFAITAEEKQAVMGAGLTLGLRWAKPLSLEDFALSGDIGGYRLFRPGNGLKGRDELIKLRTFISYKLAERLALFAGAGAFLGLRGDEDIAVRVGPEGFGGVDF
jgi:hypothetical protein